MDCTVCNSGYTLSGVTCSADCPNGVLNVGETCDNTDFSNQCCASNCLSYNLGYFLNPTGIPNATCQANCCYNPSDGIVATGTEQCDDGNTVSGDGCFNNLIESGWQCSLNATGGSVCTLIPATVSTNTTTYVNITSSDFIEDFFDVFFSEDMKEVDPVDISNTQVEIANSTFTYLGEWINPK